MSKLNSEKIIEEAFKLPLSPDQIKEEEQMRFNGEGNYANDKGGVLWEYGYTGYYTLMRYCRANNLKIVF